MAAIKDFFTHTLAGLATSQTNSPFQQCVRQALGGDGDLYSFPHDILYQIQDVKPYNLDHPVIPAAVTYPETVQQVSDLVACAHESEIACQPRSGGHSYLNFGLGGVDGALTIDMKGFKDFEYDPEDHTVTFGPGNRLGDLTDKLKPLNRVMAYGPSKDIGSGGHMTIGGLGVLGRQFGLGADQTLSAQCVLGNGSVVVATPYTNSDLFFALRGAGFSFAIVTEFTMQTSLAPSEITQFTYNITAGKITDLADTFKSWQRLIAEPNLTRLFGCTLTLTEGLLIFSGTYFGSRPEYDSLNLRGLLPSGSADLNIQSDVVTNVFNDLGELVADLFDSVPAHFYAKSLKTTRETLLSDDAVNSMFQYIDETDKDSPVWFVVWDLEGGAISDVPQSGSAYWHRDALYFLQSYVVGLPGDVSDTSKQFLDGLNQLIQQQTGADDSAYPGYVDDRLIDPQTAYWGGNLPRLQSIKAAVDPANTFRNPQSIVASG